MQIHLPEPPPDSPKMVGKMEDMNRLIERQARPKSGWALRIGFDQSGQPILMCADEIQAPNRFQRFATLLTGMKWVRTSKT